MDIKSKAAGRLLSLNIEEGQAVTKGQLIALVDRSQIDPQLTRDQAQLRQAQARLSQTQAEYALQVKQTAAAIAQARAALNQSLAHLAVVQAGARPQELAQGRRRCHGRRLPMTMRCGRKSERPRCSPEALSRSPIMTPRRSP